jgi:hypothetical protein
MRIASKTIQSLIVLAAITLGVSFAADIDGKWITQVEGRQGPRTETLMLKASGNTLTGSIEGRRGGPVQISNGNVDGDQISFSVVREFRGNQMTQQYKGALSGGELKLTMSGARGEPVQMTFKRSGD